MEEKDYINDIDNERADAACARLSEKSILFKKSSESFILYSAFLAIIISPDVSLSRR